MSRAHILDQSEIFRPELLGRNPEADFYADVCSQIKNTVHDAVAPVRDELTPTARLMLDKEVCGSWDLSWQVIALPPIPGVIVEQISSSAAA